MSEVVNVVVALAVIVFVIRWATASNESPEDKKVRAALGFRPKDVTPEMLETISTMFPDMPKDNIRYDLLRTGNVELTTNKIIERGYLDAPPAAYYRVYPRSEQQSQITHPAVAPGVRAPTGTSSAIAGPSSAKSASLISRFHLETRLEATPNIENPEAAGGKTAWEATPERREQSLKERKAQMILAARQRMLSQQEAASKAESG
ncbi:hypothetical protein DFH11DRAFT_1627649 [Phellopilus nigrolimitatus]|nr:hypothetical protein DFH11DRAFT_1627649 [Phellopilus nigrolimitatus]